VIRVAVKCDVLAQAEGDVAKRDRVAGSHLDQARPVVVLRDPRADELERR
jgi:hypothetical protein